MTSPEFEKLIQDIAAQTKDLKDKHTTAKGAPVSYVAIFCQSTTEEAEFLAHAKELGEVIEQTLTGPVFLIKPIRTVAGPLKLLKIRQPDPNRPERGDADFKVADYPNFRKAYLGQPGFILIEREKFEMIELKDKDFNVLAYFSYPPLDEQLNIKT